MNVLVCDIELEVPGGDFAFDSAQPGNDFTRFLRVDKPDLCEHVRVSDRAKDIVTIKPPIERQ
jgi:hypothetical protein